MTGLEIDNWTENAPAPSESGPWPEPNRILDSVWPSSCRSRKLTSGVQSSCGRRSTVSLVTSSSWHHVSDLRGLSKVCQEQRWRLSSTRLAMNTPAGRSTWRSTVHGHMHAWARGIRWSGIVSVRGFGKGSPPSCTVRQRTLLCQTLGHRPRFSSYCKSSGALQPYAIVWTVAFVFAEHNFRLRVNRIFNTIFDPLLSEPNRIFGLLNLSKKRFFVPFENPSSKTKTPGGALPRRTIYHLRSAVSFLRRCLTISSTNLKPSVSVF